MCYFAAMHESPQTFTIDAIDKDARLDVFLTRVTGRSRSQIQKLIKARGVTVNGNVERVVHRFLGVGDMVEVKAALDNPSVSSDETPPLGKGRKESRIGDSRCFPLLTKEGCPELVEGRGGDLVDLTILFEDEHIIVLNKHAGVLVHPVEGADEPTLMDALIAHDPKIALVGDDPVHRAGIVHRLDRMVSGVIVAAKTPEAFTSLKQQWKDRTVEKRYRALVNGQLEKTHDTITFRIARSPQAGRMVARPSSQEGRDARTDYTVTQRYANATEVDILLHTGRPHQIRAHFHALGHPVVGDPLYTIRNQKRLAFDRLWLHSYRLGFDHPVTHERMVFDAPLPAELTAFIEMLHRL